MRLVSVNVGRPREVAWKGQVVTTGIFKEPVAGRVALRRPDERARVGGPWEPGQRWARPRPREEHRQQERERQPRQRARWRLVPESLPDNRDICLVCRLLRRGLAANGHRQCR